MAIISKRKIVLKVNTVLNNYLNQSERGKMLPVSYKELNDYEDTVPTPGPETENTLWETLSYSSPQLERINEALLKTYALLKTDGDLNVIQHLSIEKVDIFILGETKPFRIKVINKINKSYDYFYVKVADASRIYGLEIENFLSPHRIEYLADKETIVEEHIPGILGSVFIDTIVKNEVADKIRLAKEFVKFNERCFVRLLGDMHPGNFVVSSIPEQEGTYYRIRAIDFDQQCYEGKKSVYIPQNYKRNSHFLELVENNIDKESIKQYQKEERSFIAKRIRSSHNQLKKLTEAMAKDVISFPEKVLLLREQLSDHYKDREFLSCKNMAEVFVLSLKQLFKN